jgi:hypothetical protein
MDLSSGIGFWTALSEDELRAIIKRPEAFSAVTRAFAAQELSNKEVKRNDELYAPNHTNDSNS